MIGAIVQARLASIRLPRKILKKLRHKTVLEWVIDRLKESTVLDKIIVAVPPEPELICFVKNKNYDVFVGDMDNVLSRYYHAAKEYNIDRIVRVTSDCPCIDPDVIDRIVGHGKGYVTIEHYPHGLDFQVFDFYDLEEAQRNAITPYDREHVVPYILRNADFATTLFAPPLLYAPDIRITLDTPEDYIVLSELFQHLPDDFRTIDIINYLRERNDENG